MSQPSPPAAPDYAKMYGEGIQVYLKNLPTLLAKEQQARAQYDPQRIQEQQDLQAKYGPTQYAQQLDAWKQLDPQGYALRQSLGNKISGMLQQGGISPLQTAAYNQLGQGVQSQYARGTQADPESLRQMEQAVRSRQGQDTAGGNAAQMAEAVYIGQRGQQLQQQRTGNLQGFAGMQSPQEKATAEAGMYLGLPSAMSQMNQIQGVSPDRASAYVNPTAGAQGAQFGLQNYANQLGQYQAGGGSTNPWMGALSGAASGAAAGTMVSPGYGTAIGAGLGLLGGYFSDAKLKQNISRTGSVTKDGIPIVEFDMAGHHYRGVIAQDVAKVRPDAVGVRDGYLTVDYEKLGIKMEEI